MKILFSLLSLLLSNIVFSQSIEKYVYACSSKTKSQGMWLAPEPCNLTIFNGGSKEENKIGGTCFPIDYRYGAGKSRDGKEVWLTSAEIIGNQLILTHISTHKDKPKLNINDRVQFDMNKKEWQGKATSPFGYFEYFGKCR